MDLRWHKGSYSLFILLRVTIWFMAETWACGILHPVIYNVCTKYLSRTWNILNSEVHLAPRERDCGLSKALCTASTGGTLSLYEQETSASGHAYTVSLKWGAHRSQVTCSESSLDTCHMVVRGQANKEKKKEKVFGAENQSRAVCGRQLKWGVSSQCYRRTRARAVNERGTS